MPNNCCGGVARRPNPGLLLTRRPAYCDQADHLSVAVQQNPKSLDLYQRTILIESLAHGLRRLTHGRLVALGRAAGLQHFTFLDAHGANLYLHTESAWRIVSNSRIVTGRSDYWRPSAPDVTDAALDAGEIGATLRDVRNEALREWIEQESPRVVSAVADVYGGLVVEFTSDYRLEIFADASEAEHDEWELWRLFERHGTHLVVRSSGGSLPEV